MINFSSNVISPNHTRLNSQPQSATTNQASASNNAPVNSNQKSLWNNNFTSIYAPKSNNPNDGSTKIKIGYINDFHGQLTKMERTIIPLQNCDIRLSGGDNFLGDERNVSLNKGVAKYMNLANIDASPVGNHELDMNQKTFMDITNGLKTKLVDCNYRQVIDDPKEAERLYNETNKAPINDRFINSIVKEVNGHKYGIIGVSPVDMNDRYTHADYYDDCKVDTMDESINDVQKEVDEFHKQGINKIILLSHLGYKLDKEMAQKTSGVDIIIGGHSHNLVEGLTEGENLLKSKTGEPVIITNGGKDGEHFGNLSVEFDKNGVITDAKNDILETSKFGRNLIYAKILENDMDENEKVGYIRSVLPQPKNRLIEENPQANFVADAIKNELGVEMAFLNSANLRSSFEPGTFTRLDAKMISPFHNQMVIANVTEKDLVDAFKFTCKTMVNTRPGLFAVSGLKYTVRKSDGELLSLTKVDNDGKETPIDIKNPSDTKTYRISADSFVMRGGDKVTSLNYVGKEEKVFDFDKDTLVCDYIKHLNKPIDINQSGRVTIV